MYAPNYCDSFTSTCKSYLEPLELEGYCEPLCLRAGHAYEQSIKPAAKWAQKATAPVVNHAKWTWQTTGKYYGPPGQLLLAVLVAGIAYNLFRRYKSSKKNEMSPEEMNRLLLNQLLMNTPPPAPYPHPAPPATYPQ